MIRLLVSLIACVALALAYRAFFSDVGYFALARMEQRVALGEQALEETAAGNQELLREVMGLQHKTQAVESRVRTDLGMIKDGESFFLVVDAD